MLCATLLYKSTGVTNKISGKIRGCWRAYRWTWDLFNGMLDCGNCYFMLSEPASWEILTVFGVHTL